MHRVMPTPHGILEHCKAMNHLEFSLSNPSKPSFKGVRALFCHGQCWPCDVWSLLGITTPFCGRAITWHSLNLITATCEEKPSYSDIFKIHLNSGKTSFYLGCGIDQRKMEMGSGPTWTHFLLCHHCPLTQMVPLPPWCGFSSPHIFTARSSLLPVLLAILTKPSSLSPGVLCEGVLEN